MLQIAGFLFLLVLLPPGGKLEVCHHRLTIFAEPGRMECYYQAVAATEHIILEYQVIYGGQAETHVNFHLMDPQRKMIITEIKQGNGKYQLEANLTGVYKLCFDNTISMFNPKIVVFNLEIAAANHDELERQHILKIMTTEYQFERSYTDMHDYVNKINVNLMRARQDQDFIRAQEAKDRKMAESNFTLVNIWSFAQLVAMIVVGLIQVFMLRSIFQTDGRFYQFWKKI